MRFFFIFLLSSFCVKAQPLDMVVQVGHTSPVYSINFNKTGDKMVSLSKGLMKIWDFTISKELKSINTSGAIKKVSFIEDSLIAFNEMEMVKILNFYTGAIINTYYAPSLIKSLDYSDVNKTFVITTISAQSKLLGYVNGGFNEILAIDIPFKSLTNLVFCGRHDSLLFSSSDGTVGIYSIKERKAVFEHYQIKNAIYLELFRNKIYVGTPHFISMIDLKANDKKLVKNYKLSKNFYFENFAIDTTSGNIVGINKDNYIYMFNPELISIKYKFRDIRATSITFHPSKSLIITGDSIGKFNVFTNKLEASDIVLSSTYAPIKDIKFSKQGSYLIFSKGPALHYFDFAELVRYNYLLDGQMKYQNLDRRLINDFEPIGKDSVLTVAWDNTDFIIKTPDNYYFASQNALNYVSFSRGLKYFPFSQFDLQYNRPDIVLRRLGLTNDEVIDQYYRAYHKRLKKLKFSEGSFSTDLHLPEIIIANKNDLITTGNQISLKIIANDSKYILRSIHVVVNGVPLYGAGGLNINYLNVARFERNINIKLNGGKNSIRVFVMNEKGVESMIDFAELDNKTEKGSTVYMISVGISHYKDSSMNLKYAAKDAVDYAKIFGKKYEKIVAITLIDSAATYKNIINVKKNILANTTEDDKVILSLSGHGIVDTSYDFYFATYDMDFKYPKVKGLSFDNINSLLDSIPARNKLLLMDACHSGELDKEIHYVQTETMARDKRGAKMLNVKPVDYKEIGSFYLMQELFSCVERNNGATIISASAGTEFAYEGENWKNGVFTYTFLDGITSGKADLNNNGEITVSELKTYCGDKVQAITKGKQSPTARQVNLEKDWKVW